MLIDDLRTQLKRDEGEILHAYQDSLGYWTIGVGHLIDVRKGGSIPQHISDELLDGDIAEKMADLIKQLPWVTGLDDARLGVLCNMAFNLGVPGLLQWNTFLGLVQAGNYDKAADDLLANPKWDKQVGDRAHRLSQQMRTGTWV